MPPTAPPALRGEPFLLLQRLPGVGRGTLRPLVEAVTHGWPAEALLAQDRATLRREFGLSDATLAALAGGLDEPRRRAAADSAWLVEHNVRVLPLEDADYPRRWRLLDEPPPIVQAHGALRLARAPLVALLVSMKAPPAALDRLTALATRVARGGVGLVGGHNMEAYRQVRLVAKRERAPHVTVLDRGLRDAFPRGPHLEAVQQARIWSLERDLSQTLVLTEHPVRCAWTPNHARARDELVVALATAVIGVSVRPDGTMHRLLLEARERGTPVTIVGDAALNPLAETLAEAGLPVLPEGAEPLEFLAGIAGA